MPHWSNMGRTARFDPERPYGRDPRNGQYLWDDRGEMIVQATTNNTTVEPPEPHRGPLAKEREKVLGPFQQVPDTVPDLTALNEAVKCYNSVLNFSPLTDVDLEVLAQRIVLRKELGKAHKTLAQVMRAIDVATKNLHDAAARDSTLLPGLNLHLHWYEQGDLFELSFDDMCGALAVHPPTDAAHFARYVRSCISKSIDNCAQDAPAARLAADHSRRGESDYGYWKVDADPGFARKALRLILELLYIEDGGVVAAFHELVWAKVNLLRLDWTLPVTLKDIETLGNAVDRIIEILLGTAQQSPSAGIPIIFKPELFDLGPVTIKSANYFDVVRMSHLIDAAWKERECEQDDPEFYMDITDIRGKSVGGCWHAHNENLTELLNEHAYDEIEYCARVATDHILPPELVDEVVEYLLLLEGFSSDYSIRDAETGAVQAKYLGWCQFISE
ncbi:hypothetical protein LTR27_000494 [Elasticomyces elasticus]|nr:hypothetical protein LTR27_000494 [Elasticomyces elasticus]